MHYHPVVTELTEKVKISSRIEYPSSASLISTTMAEEATDYEEGCALIDPPTPVYEDTQPQIHAVLMYTIEEIFDFIKGITVHVMVVADDIDDCCSRDERYRSELRRAYRGLEVDKLVTKMKIPLKVRLTDPNYRLYLLRTIRRNYV